MKFFLNLILINLFAISVFANDCGTARIIIQKPILFNTQRIKLTQQYRLQHYGIKSQSLTIVPKIIVLHWTAVKTLSGSFKDFYSPMLTLRPDIKSGGDLNVSAHFLVDRDGTIYQLMPETWMARHVIGLNNSAIGIENVGGVNDISDLTTAQADADTYLICLLKHKYPTIKYVIGHYQYQRFRHSTLWLEKNPRYFDIKYDPGKDFMQEICQLLKQYSVLGLQCLLP